MWWFAVAPASAANRGCALAGLSWPSPSLLRSSLTRLLLDRTRPRLGPHGGGWVARAGEAWCPRALLTTCGGVLPRPTCCSFRIVSSRRGDCPPHHFLVVGPSIHIGVGRDLVMALQLWSTIFQIYVLMSAFSHTRCVLFIYI